MEHDAYNQGGARHCAHLSLSKAEGEQQGLLGCKERSRFQKWGSTS